MKNQRATASRNDESQAPIVLDVTQLLGLNHFVSASEEDKQVGVADIGRYLSKVGAGETVQE